MPKAKAKANRQKRQAEITELVSVEAQRKAERGLTKFVMELDERAEKRYEWVKAILAVNDRSVAEILGWMVDRLKLMEGEPKIVYQGRTYNAIKGETELLARMQEKNFAWTAMRCLVACAEWDISIGNFKLPPDLCARCGVKVVKARKKRAA